MISLNIFSSIGLGVALAAPVGPIAMLCMRTTLRSGFWAGFSAGLGAAFADGVICFLVLSGLASAENIVWPMDLILRILSALFLLFLSIKLFRAKADLKEPELSDIGTSGLTKHFISTFAITILSPLTFVSFFAIFSVGIKTIVGFEGLVASVGVMTGSALWWLLLASGLSIARRKLNARIMRFINVSSALFMGYVGIRMLI
ncbi:MAG: LysE family transporter [Candidatus Obscuribacterales bacterium]|nr:LysE family transporter [Candidatus Obscuribacterales bacterium]